MLTTQSLVLLFVDPPELRATQEAREAARWADFRLMLRQNTHDDVAKTFKKPKGVDRHPFVVESVAQGVMSEKSAQNRLSEMRGIVKAYDLGMALDTPTGWKSAVELAMTIRDADKVKQAERREKAERDEVRNSILAQVQATNPDAKVKDLEAAVDTAMEANAAATAYEREEQNLADAVSDGWRELSVTDFANVLADRCDLWDLLPALQAIHEANQKQVTPIEAAPTMSAVDKLLAHQAAKA